MTIKREMGLLAERKVFLPKITLSKKTDVVNLAYSLLTSVHTDSMEFTEESALMTSPSTEYLYKLFVERYHEADSSIEDIAK